VNFASVLPLSLVPVARSALRNSHCRFHAGLVMRPRSAFRLGYQILCALLLMALMAPCCRASNIVFIRSPGPSPAEERELDVATQFYGIDLTVIPIEAANDGRALEAVRAKNTLGVVIEANILPAMRQQALLEALHRAPGNNVPLLILGVTPETDVGLLRAWSGGAATGANHLSGSSQLDYVVGRVSGITQELSGIDLPLSSDEADYFTLSGGGQAQDILAVRNGPVVNPTFIETTLSQQTVFLLCAGKTSGGADTQDVVHAFATVAPAMIFVKYSSGNRGWHFPHHYANFTIDDPWLREPYGNLNYKNLLAEMNQHNFYTTIAFIPWNYDRSKASVASLFRDHPDRFSICVHGDNHDHKEFEDFRSKPLNVQVADLKQGVARMAEFHKLTGISVDRVFVFPHSIGEEPILEKLRAYNFLATANSTDVPMESAAPTGVLFQLRPVTTSFGDFPSAFRYPADLPQPGTLIAVNGFLDNPLFFYTHQGFFARGIDAFDQVADDVNRLEPDTEWRSLGNIAAHLYLLRLGDDGRYEVFTFSSSARLENDSGSEQTYHIVKREPDASMIQAVTLDGMPTSYKVQNGLLNCNVTIPAGQTRDLLITYKNDLDLASINIRRTLLRVYFLREASDFRDIWLSRFSLGEAATAYYYKHYYRHGRSLARAVTLTFVAFLLVAAAVWILLLRLRDESRNAERGV
jgi:hypothetical protein